MKNIRIFDKGRERMESVVQRLMAWEREWNIQILYAVDCGSWAWGFATKESDRDVRFLYKYETKEYLRLTPPPGVLTRREREMDVVGWDVYKAGRMLVNSGITLWEWLNAPIVYLERSELAAQLRELARSTYSLQKAGFQYISAARQHVAKKMEGRERVEAKVCLYVLRFLLCLRWLERKQTLPPARLTELAEEVLPENAMHRWMNELLTRRAGQVEIVPRDHIPFDWIEGELKRMEQAVKGWPQGRDATPEVEKGLLKELGFC
jgi:uncharacterized protein